MTKAQHTHLQHNENCVVSEKCQNSPINASTTAQQQPMSVELEAGNIKDKSVINALSAAQPMLSETGEKSKLKSFKPMAGNVHAAANRILSFLQSTTLEEMVTSIESLGCEDISSINTLVNSDTRKTIIDFCVSTVIAHVVNTAAVPMKIKASARLIAAAPELLKALESAMGMVRGHQETPERIARYEFARAAIAKAKGE